MTDGPVLNVGVPADAYVMHVPSNDTVVPDAGVITDLDIAHDLSSLGDIHSFTQFWPFALILMQH